MHNKICVVCNKPFTTINSRYKTCSPKCSKIYNREYNRLYTRQKKVAGLLPNYYVKVEKRCEFCNALLPDGRQQYCESCLVKGYIHGNQSFRRKCQKILKCRGYSVQDIWHQADVLNLV